MNSYNWASLLHGLRTFSLKVVVLFISLIFWWMYSARISIKLHGQWYWKSLNNWENVTLIIVTRICIIQSCILSSKTLWGLISFQMKSAAVVRLLIQCMSLHAAVSLRQRQKLSERILNCASLSTLGEWLIEFFGDCKNWNYNMTGLVDMRSDGEPKKVESVNTDYIIDTKLF